MTLGARVRGGRLILDELIDLPDRSDLPDGSEVELLLAHVGDDLDQAGRARSHVALDRARAQVLRREIAGNDKFVARLGAEG